MKEKYARDGITIAKRKGRTGPGSVFYTRIRVNGVAKWIGLAETAEKSFQIAVAARRANVEGKFDTFRAVTRRRAVPSTVPCHTIGELLPWYRKYPGNIKTATKEQNIHALCSIVLAGKGHFAVQNAQVVFESTRLDELTDALLRRWENTIKQKAYADEVDEERCIQILRSGNSRLAQARSLFASSRRNNFPDYYRHEAGIQLPPCIAEFRERPGFNAGQKKEYHPPTDEIIAQTFACLNDDSPTAVLDQNAQVACWLAIGFGLRASEIARALCGDFKLVEGKVYFRPIWRAKNNRIPDIGVQLGAWERLAPHIVGRPAGDYVIQGTQTDRTSEVFRAISVWMKWLGWKTQHHVHELRAWAGCQIVAGPSGNDQNWESARCFLRHSHASTTQNAYGHHFHAKIVEVPLPKFVPVTLPKFEKVELPKFGSK